MAYLRDNIKTPPLIEIESDVGYLDLFPARSTPPKFM